MIAMKKFLLLSLISAFLLSCNGNAQKNSDKEKEEFEVTKTEEEWKEELTPAEFAVLRKAGTERPFSSELNDITQPGTFVCAACGNELYKTEHKFKSGTGWPSFDRPIDEKKVEYRRDRTGLEVVCANCGGHLGHRFNDGPRNATGKRHCINGVAMKFIPEGS